jgi:broad specificity phosphatase PhoE
MSPSHSRSLPTWLYLSSRDRRGADKDVARSSHEDPGQTGVTWPRMHTRTVRLFVFARHAQSAANVAGAVSSDPRDSVGLTARGKAQARQLGAQLANLEIDLAVCTRFLRTQQTLELALQGRQVPVVIDAGFDEVQAGDFDGEPIESYWSWEQYHNDNRRFPHGESIDEALIRYAASLRRLLLRVEPVTFLVVHEFALHHITAAASSSSPSHQPSFANALPYLLDQQAVERAATYLHSSSAM